MTTLEKQTEAIDRAVDDAADAKFDAIHRFMDAELTRMSAFEKEGKLRTAGKREGDSDYDEAAKKKEAAHVASEDALDDLIAAEFAYRSAQKASNEHHAALDKANAGGSVDRLQ